MKNQKAKIAIKIICGIIAAFLLVVILDLNCDVIKRQVNKTVPVEIYDSDGVKKGETAITINGTYYPHLFKRDVYFGEFSLPELPETEKTGTNAEIQWIKRRGYNEKPMIIHYGDTVYENLGSAHIGINRKMDEIAWWTTEGTLATSYEAYSNYIYFKK